MTINPKFYPWMRQLHLYIGLFISPFILVFAVSTILFNHTWMPWGGASEGTEEKTTASVEIPAALEGVEQAKEILRQVGVSGEIQYLRHQDGYLIIPVVKPGQRIIVEVELEQQMARVVRRHTGVWDAVLYLHKSPGPHNVKIRGNWFFTRLWGFLADTMVYMLLFVSASGVYLWTVIKAERKTGLVLLGAGGLSFLLIVFSIV